MIFVLAFAGKMMRIVDPRQPQYLIVVGSVVVDIVMIWLLVQRKHRSYPYYMTVGLLVVGVIWRGSRGGGCDCFGGLISHSWANAVGGAGIILCCVILLSTNGREHVEGTQ